MHNDIRLLVLQMRSRGRTEMPDSDLMLFALEASRPYGERVSRALEVPLSSHEERHFEDGEHKELHICRTTIDVGQCAIISSASFFNRSGQVF